MEQVVAHHSQQNLVFSSICRFLWCPRGLCQGFQYPWTILEYWRWRLVMPLYWQESPIGFSLYGTTWPSSVILQVWYDVPRIGCCLGLRLFKENYLKSNHLVSRSAEANTPNSIGWTKRSFHNALGSHYFEKRVKGSVSNKEHIDQRGGCYKWLSGRLFYSFGR